MTTNSLSIQSLPSSIEAASRVACSLGIMASQIDIHEFPDGELRVTTRSASSTTILFASFNQPNDKLLACLFAAEGLRRSGVNRLVLIAPYLCYMRQDAVFHAGESVSQNVVGSLIANALIDDFHSKDPSRAYR